MLIVCYHSTYHLRENNLKEASGERTGKRDFELCGLGEGEREGGWDG